MTFLLLGGLGVLLVNLFGGDSVKGGSEDELLIRRLNEPALSAAFVPHSLSALDGGYALLLINPKTAEWEVRTFAPDGEFNGGIAARRPSAPLRP